jgi:hypothetical protein
VTVVRIIVAAIAIVSVVSVLFSVLRTVVLPRGVPARLARLTFLAVRALLLVRLRLLRRSDYETRDRVFALQAPLGLFAQLFVWSTLILVSFAGLFWSVQGLKASGDGVARAVELSGSSMLTLGIETPRGLAGHLVAFAAAGLGLTLLALVITYLPSLYAAFSRREALIAKLVTRTGTPPSGIALLCRSWTLGRFDDLEEVWDGWENWFIEIAESHTTFPQLAFFRSPHIRNHWVLAGESVLDGAALLMTICDVPRQSRAELCLEAGVGSLGSIADFLGIPHEPPEPDTEILLSRDLFTDAHRELTEAGIPTQDDVDEAWNAFRRLRARYEPLLAVLGAMTDAPRSEWSSWSDGARRHSPPLIRINRQ